MTTGPGQDHCDCKIGEAIETYGIDDLDEKLLMRRRDRGESLRDLAEYVNRRVLESAIQRDSDDVFDTDIELFGALDKDEAMSVVYEALADDETDPNRRVRVRTRLDQAGVDPETIEDHWVTHPTVRKHFNNCLDVDTSRSPEIDTDAAIGTIEWARARCLQVIERTVQRLTAAGGVSISDPEVSVSIHISCTKCRRSYTASDLLSRGRCDCETPDELQPS